MHGVPHLGQQALHGWMMVMCVEIRDLRNVDHNRGVIIVRDAVIACHVDDCSANAFRPNANRRGLASRNRESDGA